MRSSSQCAERSGFLFKHRCDRMGQRECQECQECGKRICQHHVVAVDTGLVQDGSDSLQSGNALVCASCAKRIRKSSRRSEQGYYYDSHPYFYGDSHYHGWGHGHSAGASSGGEPAYDANDLTEADGEATEIPGDEGFETDMEGS